MESPALPPEFIEHLRRAYGSDEAARRYVEAVSAPRRATYRLNPLFFSKPDARLALSAVADGANALGGRESADAAAALGDQGAGAGPGAAPSRSDWAEAAGALLRADGSVAQCLGDLAAALGKAWGPTEKIPGLPFAYAADAQARGAINRSPFAAMGALYVQSLPSMAAAAALRVAKGGESLESPWAGRKVWEPAASAQSVPGLGRGRGGGGEGEGEEEGESDEDGNKDKDGEAGGRARDGAEAVGVGEAGAGAGAGAWARPGQSGARMAAARGDGKGREVKGKKAGSGGRAERGGWGDGARRGSRGARFGDGPSAARRGERRPAAPIAAARGPGGLEVLDLCAAPGGKTALIAQMMGHAGYLAANEPDKNRFFRMMANLKRLGVQNVRLFNHDGRMIGDKTPGRFDRVLVDAPCSADSLISPADPKSWAHWSPKLVRRMSRLQRRLLASGFAALRPGGLMVYSTCAVGLEENELALGAFLAETPAASLEPVFAGMSRFGSAWAIPGREAEGAPPEIACAARFLPNGDAPAFFIAAIRKAE